jgi:hypothetical protein
MIVSGFSTSTGIKSTHDHGWGISDGQPTPATQISMIVIGFWGYSNEKPITIMKM